RCRTAFIPALQLRRQLDRFNGRTLKQMPRGRPNKNPTLAGQLEALTKQLTALTERVREAEGIKNAVDAVYRTPNAPYAGKAAPPRHRRRTPAEMAASGTGAASA